MTTTVLDALAANGFRVSTRSDAVATLKADFVSGVTVEKILGTTAALAVDNHNRINSNYRKGRDNRKRSDRNARSSRSNKSAIGELKKTDKALKIGAGLAMTSAVVATCLAVSTRAKLSKVVNDRATTKEKRDQVALVTALTEGSSSHAGRVAMMNASIG